MIWIFCCDVCDKTSKVIPYLYLGTIFYSCTKYPCGSRKIPLKWHKRRCVPNHRQLDCLFNRYSRLTTTEVRKLHITCLLWGESLRWISLTKGLVRKEFPRHEVVVFAKPSLRSQVVTDMTYQAPDIRQTLPSGSAWNTSIQIYIKTWTKWTLFADDILKSIFFSILIQNSPKFIPGYVIYKKSILAQVIAWRLLVDNPLIPLRPILLSRVSSTSEFIRYANSSFVPCGCHLGLEEHNPLLAKLFWKKKWKYVFAFLYQLLML